MPQDIAVRKYVEYRLYINKINKLFNTLNKDYTCDSKRLNSLTSGVTEIQ